MAYPLPIVLACVLHEGNILLIRRTEPQIAELDGRWELPGGKLEPGESPSKAAERETREETGWDVVADEMLPFPYVATRRTSRDKLSIIALCYRCHLTGKSTTPKISKKVSDVSWIPISDLDPIGLQSGSATFIRHVLLSSGNPHQFGAKLSSAYISFQSIDPGTNRFREYHILFEGNLLAEQPYSVQTSWHRTSQPWQAKIVHFTSKDDANSYISRTVRTRLNHKYLVTSVSSNFTLLTGIETPAITERWQKELF